MAWLKRSKPPIAKVSDLTNVTTLTSASHEVETAPVHKKPVLVPASAILIALLAAAGAASNWDRWIANRSIQSTDDAAVFADVSNISARVSGTIEAVSAQDYTRVKAGDVLFTIDRAPYEVSVRSSKAKLEAARAQLEDNGSQRTFQLAQIDVAVAQLQASSADEVQTKKELERQVRLANDGGPREGVGEFEDERSHRRCPASATRCPCQAAGRSHCQRRHIAGRAGGD
jgi:membrane fusion protein (multidrug efflux system)